MRRYTGATLDREQAAMTLGFVLQVVISGLAAGAIYGLVAIGFSLVYRLTSVLHFAHGDLLGTGLFVALFVAAGSQPATTANVGIVRATLAYVVAIAFGAAAGAGVYAGAIRPFFKRASAVGWIGATVALAFALQSALSVVFPRQAYVLPDPFGFTHATPIGLTGGASLPVRTLWILGVAMVCAVAADRVLSRTRFGVAVGAISSDPAAAQFVGLPVDALTAKAFAFAGSLAVLAGVVGAPAAGSIATSTGLVLGLKGIAAALLAGMGTPHAVLRAALALGVFEAAVTSLHVPGFPRLALGPSWHDVAPLVLVVVVLALRPPAEAVEPLE